MVGVTVKKNDNWGSVIYLMAVASAGDWGIPPKKLPEHDRMTGLWLRTSKYLCFSHLKEYDLAQNRLTLFSLWQLIDR